MNKLLIRQIKKHFGSLENLPVELKGIINDINNTYDSFDDDTKLLQNSIEISSQELRNAYQKHKQDAETQKETIQKIQEAIYTIKPASKISFTEKDGMTSDSSYLFDSLIALIEERKQVEDALRWNQSLLQLMSESSPLGFLVVDNRNDNILYFNQRFCELWEIQHLADRMRQGRTKNNDIIPDCLKVLSDVSSFAESCKPLQSEDNRIVIEDEIAFTEGRTIRRFSTQIRGENDEYYGRFYIFEDITERKRTADKLLESESRFRHMADHAPVLIWKSGIDSLCDYFNQTWLNFTGRTLEQEIGNGWAEGVHPDDFQYCLDTYLESFKERRKFTMEYRLKHADGNYRWLLDNGVPRFTSQGTFIGFIGTCTDISENKRVEETLRNLTRAVEQSPVSTLITDTKGNIEYGNPKVFELAGYTPEELIGKNVRIFSSGEKSKEEYKLLWETILAGNEWKGEFHNKKKNGDLYWEFESISAIKNTKGEIVNFLGIKEDITERKLAEQNLKNERTLFRTIIDLIPDAVYVKDLQGRKIMANPKEVQLAGKATEAEVIGKTDFELYPADRVNYSLSEDLFVQKGQSILNAEATLTDLQGKVHSLLISKVPLFDGQGNITGLVGVSHDITDRKQAEDEIKAVHKSLSDILQAAIHTSIISTDLNGVISVYSAGAEKMLGYSANEIIGKKTPAIFHLESEIAERGEELSLEFGRKIEGFEIFVAKAKNQDHEERTWTYVHKNGSKIYVNLIVTAIRNKNNEAIGFLGIAIDITKRKEAELAFLESTKKWEAIISSSPDGIGIVSLDGKLEFMSDKLAKIYGYSIIEKDDYIGKSLFDFIEPSDHNRLIDNFQKLLNGNEEYEITEYQALRKDNSKFFVDVNSTVLHDENGKPSSILFIERDITQRKLVEAELEESREKFRGLSEASFEAIFISEKGYCIEQNRAAEMMFGYTLEEAKSKFGTDFIVPEDRERVLKNMMSGFEEPYEAVAIRKDGTSFPCVLHGRMMHYKGRDVRVTSLTDISLLKKVELELLEAKEAAEDSERKFRSIIQSQAEGIGFVNQNEVFEFANTASERIFETEENGLVGISLYDFLKPDEKLKVDQQTRNRGVGYVNSYELQIITKKGNTKYIHVTATPKLDGNNNYLGAYGVFQDITDRKNAEVEVIRVSSRLAMATLAGGIGVWEMDLTNNVLFADDQLFRLFGVEKKNINEGNKSWLANIHPDDAERIQDEIELAIRGEKQFDTEFRVCWPDGSIHNLRTLAILQFDELGNAIRMIGTDWDITEQKKAETILLNATKEAEKANKAKSVFLANMSHEIRTPLNAIIGFSQLMNRDRYLNSTQKEYTASIIRAGEHLLALINDIIDLSKMEAGRLELNPTNVDLHSLFADIQMMFKEPIKTKCLQYIFETADDLPRFIFVDDNKLRRIFINLIGNAIKFTDEGGIAVRTRVDVIDELNYRLIVDVQDSGPGISDDELNKLFKQFVQTSSGINKTSGSGLGLALSRELAILMGGDITVKSEVGKGSTFTFKIRIQKSNINAIQRIITKRVTGIDQGNSIYRVLVVDDTEENLQVVVNLLNLVGFETMEAHNGKEAITKFNEWRPDLVLMDIRMPVLDGYEATRQIKLTEIGMKTPVVALTASLFDENRKNFFDLGFQDYIRKPFRESELFGTIGNVLGIKYTYEDDSPANGGNYWGDRAAIDKDIAKLPEQLIIQMLDAIDVADLDLLIELIKKIDSNNLDLSNHLMSQANNYNYDYLHQILSKK